MTKDYKIKLMKAKKLMVTFNGNLIEAKRMLKEEFGKEEYMSLYNDSKHILKTLRKYNKKLNRKQTRLLNDFAEYVDAHENLSDYSKEDRPYLVQIIGPFYCTLYFFDYNSTTGKGVTIGTIYNLTGKGIAREDIEAVYLLAQMQHGEQVINYDGYDEDAKTMKVDVIKVNHVYDFKHVLFGNGSWREDVLKVHAEYISVKETEENGEEILCEFIDFADTNAVKKGEEIANKIAEEKKLKAILEAEYLTFSEMNAKYNGNILAIAFSDKPIERIKSTYSIDEDFIKTLNTESKYKTFRKKILSENHPDKGGTDRDFLIAEANMRVLKQYLDKECIIKKEPTKKNGRKTKRESALDKVNKAFL